MAGGGGRMTMGQAASERKQRFVRKNTDVARALFGVIRESLAAVLGQQPLGVRDQIEGALARVNGCWPHIESLFELAYVECLEGEHYAPDGRRTDYVTRLAVAKMLAAVSDEVEDGQTRRFYRAIAPGVQAFLRSLLSQAEWSAFNRLAYDVFRFTGGDSDRHLEAHFRTDGMMMLLCERLFVAMMMRFDSYRGRCDAFLAIMNEAGKSWPQPVTEPVFSAIFSAWFAEYGRVVSDPEGALRFGVYYGAGAPGQVQRLVDEQRASPGGGGLSPAPPRPALEGVAPERLQGVFGAAAAGGRPVDLEYRPPESLSAPIPVTLPSVDYQTVLGKASEKFPPAAGRGGERRRS